MAEETFSLRVGMENLENLENNLKSMPGRVLFKRWRRIESNQNRPAGHIMKDICDRHSANSRQEALPTRIESGVASVAASKTDEN